MGLLTWLRSFNTQLFISHLLVAVTTSVLILVISMGMAQLGQQPLGVPTLLERTEQAFLAWQLNHPEPAPLSLRDSAGLAFALAADAAGRVVYARGASACAVGDALSECAPTAASAQPGVHYLTEADLPAGVAVDDPWVAVRLDLVDGGRFVVQMPAIRPTDTQLSIVGLVITGFWWSVVVYAVVVTLLTIPPGLVMTWLWARPLARRLAAITRASRRFADGDLTARAHDPHVDEVGQLARQFDDMADTLAQNIGVLRDLAQQNAALLRQAEEGAIQAERLRLARDLHDEIAQQLFSLSLHAATLPDQIARDPTQATTQARAVAELAEQAQMDLRTILLELRPSQVRRQGLSEAIQDLCRQWQAVHQLPVEVAVVLSGRYLPTGVEDVIYRVTREALANVAKHARARSVAVALVEGRQTLTLSVTDDGVGFDAQATPALGHYGLAGMRERTQALGGSLTIESDTNRGTTLRLTVPLARPEPDPTAGKETT